VAPVGEQQGQEDASSARNTSWWVKAMHAAGRSTQEGGTKPPATISRAQRSPTRSGSRERVFAGFLWPRARGKLEMCPMGERECGRVIKGYEDWDWVGCKRWSIASSSGMAWNICYRRWKID
jgi:hypothetical protein